MKLKTVSLFLLTFVAGSIHGQKAIEVIAFGSCLKETRPQPIWEAVLEANPDVFVMLGDNIYGDTRDMVKLRQKWRTLDEVPGFRRLRSECRLLAIWDDHDYGENDAGASYPKKVESQEAFLDFLNEPEDSPRRKTPGIYDAQIIGPPEKRVQFILLDTRYFRTALLRNPSRKRGQGPYMPNPDPKARILGPEQWKWLKDQLLKPAEIRVIASSIQVLSIHHGWETWGNFPKERDRLLKLIKTTKANGVVFLSGDRHSAEISKLDVGVPYPILDATASAMNQRQKPVEEYNPYRISKHYFNENFGLMKINWSGNIPNISLQIMDLEGKLVDSRKVVFSESQ